ncbi:MAG: exopolysaccharide biosynthesis protein [Deltaproteobacteria bacterium]|nr:exopolysaccharide biosynthesis protein [Deltaproteobacteria bacterium]
MGSNPGSPQIEAGAPNGARLSSELANLTNLCQQKKITLGSLIDSMTARSHALITLIFALPFLLPVPLPGLSVVFGLVIIMAGGAMAIGKKPWLPDRLLRKEVSSQLLGKIFGHGARISRTLEWIIKPRGSFVVRHPGVRQINGLIMAVCGLLLALPLPPGTNFPPAGAILLLSLGSLEEDILFMLFGYAAFAINLLFFGGIWHFGAHALKLFLAPG